MRRSGAFLLLPLGTSPSPFPDNEQWEKSKRGGFFFPFPRDDERRRGQAFLLSSGGRRVLPPLGQGYPPPFFLDSPPSPCWQEEDMRVGLHEYLFFSPFAAFSPFPFSRPPATRRKFLRHPSSLFFFLLFSPPPLRPRVFPPFPSVFFFSPPPFLCSSSTGSKRRRSPIGLLSPFFLSVPFFFNARRVFEASFIPPFLASFLRESRTRRKPPPFSFSLALFRPAPKRRE